MNTEKQLAAAVILFAVWPAVAVALVLTVARSAAAATAYYSFQGSFTDGTETQSFLFNTDAVMPHSAPFLLRTWQYDGGTNAAGELISAGGFDSILRLYNDTPELIAENDDYNPPGRDSLIDWNTLGMPEALRADGYWLDLVAYGGTLGGRSGDWAVDLVGPADTMTLTGASDDGPLGSTIYWLAIGTDGADRTPAQLNLGPSQNLTVDQVIVGNTGNAEVRVSTDSIMTTDNAHVGYGGYGGDNTGSVTIAPGGSWRNGTSAAIGSVGGEGNLHVESGLASFGSFLYLGYSLGSVGNVTVTGVDSYLIVNEYLFVGEYGVGFLRIDDRGQVDSGSGDLIGEAVGFGWGSRGSVEVDGKDSLWETDELTVGREGQGTVNITGGGKIDTMANAYIGRYSNAHDSSVTLTGAAPDGTPSTWQVSGDLYIAGTESGPSNAYESHLTINPGGLVDVTGTTTYWEGDGWLELHGGTLRTGALVKGCGTFDWTSGTLELTNSGLTLDSNTPDSVFGNTLPIGAGKKLVLSSTDPYDFLVVGQDGVGALEVQAGGSLETHITPWWLGLWAGSNGTITVTGSGANWTMGSGGYVGAYGVGRLEITAGGHVQFIEGWNSSISMGSDAGGYGTGLVDGEQSRWDVSGSLYVGGGVSGAGGTAMLSVENGGQLNVTGETKVFGDDSITVTGLSSHWQAGPVTIGAGGIGTAQVTLADQARIDSGPVTIGTDAGNGSAIVNGYTPFGLRPVWAITGLLTVGSGGMGSGALTVENAGWVTVSGDATIRGSMDATGRITVRADGQLDVAGTLRVQDHGTVVLLGSQINTYSFIVEPGGTFTHTDGTLTVDSGTFDPGLGDYVIAGADSDDRPKLVLTYGAQGALSGALIVGQDNYGEMTIENGATLSATNVAISLATTAPGSSKVTVQGSGSRLIVTDPHPVPPFASLEVGFSGPGELIVSAGGQVQVQQGGVSLGCCTTPPDQFGSGQITVEGQDSRLEATYVDFRAKGADSYVRIRDHGVVHATDSTYSWNLIWPDSSHTIEVDVSDAGSLLQIDGETLRIEGYGGVARLTIHDGGRAQVAGDVWLRAGNPASAYVNVDGGAVGSAILEVGGTVYVGGNNAGQEVGTAVLTVANNGVMIAGNTKVWQPGTVELNGGIISTGSVHLAGGTLRGNGEVSLPTANSLYNSGIVAPGLSPGVLTVSGGLYVQDANGTLEIEIGGTSQFEYDQLQVVDGRATLAGTVDVSLIDLGGGVFAPRAGDWFEILTAAGGVTGMFDLDHSIFPYLDGLYWEVDDSSGTSIVLRVSAFALPGDFNGDGSVDAADYVVWRKNPGGIYTPDDYDTWRANFGRTAGSGAGTTTGASSGAGDAIPEPATLLLLIGTVFLALQRRFRSETRSGVVTRHLAPTAENHGSSQSERRGLMNRIRLLAAVAAIVAAAARPTEAELILAQTDFGTADGTDVSPFSTSYTPFPGGSPTPDHYWVAQSAAGHSWSSFDWGGQDHTNPGTGSFVVVDGSTNSNLAILSYTVMAVTGAQYDLSGWVQIVQSGNGRDVELSFRVNGTQLGTFPFEGTPYNDIEWVWRPFTFSYTAAASGLTIFALHDNETSFGYNDFGLDDLVLSSSQPALPGDYNGDGSVDAADYVVWRKNPGGIYTPDDYDTWRANFGRTAGSGAALGPPSDAVVPEPNCLPLLVAGGILMAWAVRGDGRDRPVVLLRR